MTTLIMLHFNSLNAQSKFLVGGSLSFSQNKFKSSTVENIQKSQSISPEFGISIKSTFLLGLRFSHFQTKTNGDLNLRNQYYGIFARYRHPIGNKFNFIGEFGPSYNRQKTFGSNNKDEIKSFLLRLSPGFEFKLSKRWLIITKWGLFEYRKLIERSPSSDQDATSLGFNLDARNLSFGLNFYFGGKE